MNMEFNPWLDACSFGQAHGVFTDDDSPAGIVSERLGSKDTSFPRSQAGAAPWQTDVSSPTDVWRNDDGGSTTYSTLPDSWSQTLDSLLGSTLDGTHTSSLSPRSSPETSSVCTSSGDSTRLFSSAASSASSSGPSHSTSPRPYRLSLPLSPSDPFDILPSDSPKQGSSLSVSQRVASDASASKPPNAVPGLAFAYPTSTSLPDSSAPTQTPISYLTSTSTSAAGPAFRLLLPGQPPSPPLSTSSTTQSQAQVHATCVAPSDLALHRLPVPAPKHHTMPLANPSRHGNGNGSVPAGSVPSTNAPSMRGYYPPMRNLSGGLSGWTPSQSLPTTSALASTVGSQPDTRASYALASAIVPGLKPPCPRPSAGRLSLPSSSNASNNNNSWSSRSSLPNLTASSGPGAYSAAIDTEATVAARRTRRNARKLRYSLGSDDDDGEENGEDDDDDDDSEDAYQPSTSSSPDIPSRPNSREGSPPYSPFTLNRPSHNGVDLGGGYRPKAPAYSKGIQVERSTRRGKGKAKGSAALALAVVTQMSRMQQQQQASGVSSSSSLTPSSLLSGTSASLLHNASTSTSSLLYHNQLSGNVALGPNMNEDGIEVGGGDLLDGHRGLRKRKNSSIPLPVPVPHLIKKSRGRKVPYVAPLDGSLSLEGEVGGGGGSPTSSTTSSFAHRSFSPSSPLHTLSSSLPSSLPSSSYSAPLGRPSRTSTSTRGGSRKSSTPTAYSLAEGGKRTYMCEVPGCGKCFVRGEHLKRHVRSIHTWDKPHPCPYNGCDKTFSRRDNLGQHVRVHLQV